DRAGLTCRRLHTQHRCFSRLDDAWRAEFGDEVERPRWADLLRSGVAIFDQDFDVILCAMYALSISVESDCYRCVPPNPGIATAALGASESGTLPSNALASAWHTFKLFLSSLPPLPPSPASPCVPCVEGRQRAAPHSSFPPMTAPLQTLHMDVWGPAHVSGQIRERYFLVVVDDYTRYTTVFPLRSKGKFVDVLIPWICAVHLQLRDPFRADLPVLHLHSDRGGEFSSDLLWEFCRGEGILQSFTLPASPQQNGIAEHRIGLVMEVPRTSMIHAAAPHFLWSFAVWYAAHQLNLWPRVSLPETSPTLRWTGKVGDASVFRDVTFDKSVPFYRLFPYRSAPLPPSPLFLPPGPPPVDPLPPQGPTPSGVSQVDPPPGAIPGEVAVDSSAARGTTSGGAETGGVEVGGAEPGGGEPEGVEPGGAESEGAESGGAEPQGGASCGATGAGGAKAVGAGGAGVIVGAGVTGGTAATGPGGVRTWGTGVARTGGVGGVRIHSCSCSYCTASTVPAATAAIMATPSVLTFDAEGRPIKFEVWLDDLHLFLQITAKDDVSLYDHTSGAAPAPPTTADSTARSQWQTCDAHARLAVRSHLPLDEREHFGQHKTAKELYDAVVARYSSPAIATIGRLSLPYLFPDLSAFATVADLITHLRTSDLRYRAAFPPDFLATNPPPRCTSHCTTLSPASLTPFALSGTSSLPSPPLTSLSTSSRRNSYQLRRVL
ncbi:unnamed protein product, partial [Closterium sp. NIES-54]